MGTTNCHKFRLLLWKNYILQKRHPSQTVVQILLPLIFVALLIAVRAYIDPEFLGQGRYSPWNPLDATLTDIFSDPDPATDVKKKGST